MTDYPQTYKFLKLKHHHINLPYGKVLLKEQSSMLNIELKVLRIISLVEMKEDVN
jgi:hypothetical protein